MSRFPAQELFTARLQACAKPVQGRRIPRRLHRTSPDSPFDTIREALQKLGLNLERARGSDEVLVIDRVQRPTGRLVLGPTAPAAKL
jgi:uncharacterized protein (TIGR03435 family)